MSTLVNLLLAIVLNILGVQVQERVQERQATMSQQTEVLSEEKINICQKVDSLYSYATNANP